MPQPTQIGYLYKPDKYGVILPILEYNPLHLAVFHQIPHYIAAYL